MKEGATKNYELTFILNEKFTPELSGPKIEAVKKLVADQNGVITNEEIWGRRELAYEIKSNRTGFYVTFWIDIDGKGLQNLQQELNFDEEIIRFLATKAYTEAQPGTLYPVVETEGEKTEKPATSRPEKEEAPVSAEEDLRRHSASPAKSEKTAEKTDDLPEEERLEKLDEALETLLKDEE